MGITDRALSIWEVFVFGFIHGSLCITGGILLRLLKDQFYCTTYLLIHTARWSVGHSVSRTCIRPKCFRRLKGWSGVLAEVSSDIRSLRFPNAACTQAEVKLLDLESTRVIAIVTPDNGNTYKFVTLCQR